MLEEVFVPIKGYEGRYEVSNLGRVRSLDTHLKGRIRKLTKKPNGYMQIDLKKNGVRKKFHVHRLVAIHFISNDYSKPNVNHIDGDKTNNVVTNLEWVTQAENVKHSHETGLCKGVVGENHKYSKLTKEKVIEIRKRREQGETTHSIAKDFGVVHQTVSKICLRSSWKSVV